MIAARQGGHALRGCLKELSLSRLPGADLPGCFQPYDGAASLGAAPAQQVCHVVCIGDICESLTLQTVERWITKCLCPCAVLPET